MVGRKTVGTVLVAALAMGPLMACESMPGGRREQAATVGGAGGAVAGAVLAEDSLLGALIGGALGAGGGYLIGAEMNKIDERQRDEALEAHRRAEEQPARAEDARGARDADLNNDGFVTLDEVIAMHEAGIDDLEMIRMLERTGQVFELTSEQEQQLRRAGVSQRVIREMPHINREQVRPAREQQPPRDVIGEPAR